MSEWVGYRCGLCGACDEEERVFFRWVQWDEFFNVHLVDYNFAIGLSKND
jgi:hypothetical protein